jgi:hypothetical protein
MDTCLHTLLPYGLSSQYRDFVAGRKDTRVQCGPPLFRIASLLELSKPNPFGSHKSPPASSAVTQRQQRTRKRKFESFQHNHKDMGFQRNIRKINMGPATGKEKRGRVRRKPQVSFHKVSKTGSKYDPGTRVGTSQELPITLDSDDDALASSPPRYVAAEGSYNTTQVKADVHSPDPNRSHILLVNPNLRDFRYNPHGATNYEDARSGSAYESLENSYEPAGFILRRPSPAATTSSKHHRSARLPKEAHARDVDRNLMYQDTPSLDQEKVAVVRKPAKQRKRHQYPSPRAAYDEDNRIRGAGIYTGSVATPDTSQHL